MLNRLYSWYGKRIVWGILGTILLLLIAGLIINQKNPTIESADGDRLPLVDVARISDLNGVGSLQLVGTVEAVDEVRLESEAAGRITSVPATLGAQVSAGQVIAQIENASEYAALLQAEGAYEAALAAAAVSDVGVAEAENNAVSVYRDAYTTVNNIVLNTIDDLFGNPKARTPGLRISGGARATYLNNERYAFNTMLADWQESTVTITTASDLDAALREARSNVVRVQAMVDVFIARLETEDAGRFTDSEIATFETTFASARASLDTTLSQLDSAVDTLERAYISGTGSNLSSADAAVKQALGALRAAEATYAKTIIRTPIAGTVNTLPVKRGDYVSISSPVAIVANNNALEITTFISESDRERIAVGDTVQVETAYTGTITTIAPAVDPNTKKIEVKIQSETDEIANGDTVRLSIKTNGVTEESGPVIIPITALKVETDRIVVFTVSGDNTLIAKEVTEGPLVGSDIIIEAGLTSDLAIVIDARGLNEGDEVEVAL